MMKKYLAFICVMLSSFTVGFAGDMGLSFVSDVRPVIAIFGSYASFNGGSYQSYTEVNNNLYTYTKINDPQNTGYIGGFLGIENGFFSYEALFQAGLEYAYYWPFNVKGVNAVSVPPYTSNTLYNFQYQFQTQQVLAALRFLYTHYDPFRPYLSIGLGAAWNDASQYYASGFELVNINPTPIFANKTRSQFSYSLGFGLDIDIYSQTRIALGYRYSYFGTASLGGGEVMINNNPYPTTFTLKTTNVDSSALFIQLSYVF